MMSQRTTSTRKDQPVLAGQQELSDGMAQEGFTPGTQTAYTRGYLNFAKRLKGKTGLEADVLDAKRYLAEMKRSGATQSVYSNASGALKFFYEQTLKRDWELTGVPVPKREKRLPVILTRKEVDRILERTRAKQWQRKHSALLLPGVVYHLITFTVPAGLRRVIRSHPRELLELLMRLSSDTLLDVAANEKWLGATPGLTAALHT